MDKGEGLEQKSNDWERAKSRHIDYGRIRKFWGRLWESKAKKEKSRKKRGNKIKKKGWNCLRLKASQR